jgi:WD40 repeat protein
VQPLPEPDLPAVERRELQLEHVHRDALDPLPNGHIRQLIAPDEREAVVPPPVDFIPREEFMHDLPPEVAAQLRWLLEPDQPPQVDPRVPLVRSIKAHTTCVWSVAFSADGGTLLTADGYFGPPGHVKRWKTATGELLDTLLQAESDVQGAAFSPDESLVAAAAGDAGLQLIDVKTRAVKSRISHPSYVRSAAFARDGRWTASNCESFVRVWDIDLNRERWRASLQGELRAWRIATPLAFAPDGKTLAVTSGSSLLHVHDAATGKLVAACLGHEGLVICTAYAPDGKLLASGSFDRTIRLWDTATYKETRSLSGHGDWVFRVAFAPDGKTLASAGREGAVFIWDVATGKSLGSFAAHSSEAVCVAFSPDGKLLASSGVDGTVKLWDVSALRDLPAAPRR